MTSSRTITTTTPSRRAVIRTAAWSVPVISVAATAPAFAASPVNTSSFVRGTPNKWSKKDEKHVSWDLTLNVGSTAITKIVATFTYVPTGSGGFDASTFVIRKAGSATDGALWQKTPTSGQSSTVTATYTAGFAAGSSTLLHIDFAGGDNSSGYVSASFEITYAGTPTTTQTLNTGNISWVMGDPHLGH